jgi:hypothetical protein
MALFMNDHFLIVEFLESLLPYPLRLNFILVLDVHGGKKETLTLEECLLFFLFIDLYPQFRYLDWEASYAARYLAFQFGVI